MIIHWRDTYLWFGIVQVLLCLPLHLMLGRDIPVVHGPHMAPERSHTVRGAAPTRVLEIGIGVFRQQSYLSALPVHLIPLGYERGTLLQGLWACRAICTKIW